MPRIFVYGTLRRGEANHALLHRARLLGYHCTEPRYTLLDLGSYPGVVEGGHTAIRGEVYELDGPLFARVDELEDYPRLYNRRLIPTSFGLAWLYLYRGPHRRCAPLPSGDWCARS